MKYHEKIQKNIENLAETNPSYTNLDIINYVKQLLLSVEYKNFHGIIYVNSQILTIEWSFPYRNSKNIIEFCNIFINILDLDIPVELIIEITDYNGKNISKTTENYKIPEENSILQQEILKNLKKRDNYERTN